MCVVDKRICVRVVYLCVYVLLQAMKYMCLAPHVGTLRQTPHANVARGPLERMFHDAPLTSGLASVDEDRQRI